jgi:hypothetical protein
MPAISERDLTGHLKGEAELAADKKDADAGERDASLTEDYGLSEALNVLKGMVLARVVVPAPTTVASNPR